MHGDATEHVGVAHNKRPTQLPTRNFTGMFYVQGTKGGGANIPGSGPHMGPPSPAILPLITVPRVLDTQSLNQAPFWRGR